MDIVLNRDDCLAIVSNYSNADLKTLCKKVKRSIKGIIIKGFSITVETDLQRTK